MSATQATAERQSSMQTATAVAVLLATYTAIAVVALGGRLTEPILLMTTLLLAAQLLMLTVVDWSCLRLPDPMTIALAISGLGVGAVRAPSELGWQLAAIAAGFSALAALGAAYRRLSGRHGLGLGDAKLLGAAGAWVGIDGLASVVLWGSGLAIVAVLVAAVAGHRLSATTRIAFGPFLALGIWMVWLLGPVG